jgi:N-dimethylarginine dimethylaminohydrolase
MIRPAQILGLGIGACVAMLLLGSVQSPKTPQRASAAMLSECNGVIREIVIQYTHGADAVLPVYQQFLPMLPRGIVVDVVVPDADAFNELQASLPPVSCTLHPIFTNHPMTAWSRDRWVALQPQTPGDPITLLAPHSEYGADTWPARAGDQRIAFDIARNLSPAVIASRSGLDFDGGDLLCDGANVFVTSAVLHRNLNHTIATRDELIHTLETELHRPIVLMDDSPDHHAGMYMMAAANHTMLIADPALAKNILPADADILQTLPGGPDFSAATQHQLDALANQCRSLGYHIVRIPTIPGMDRKTYLTYVNVITDERDGHRTVYMPIYRGAETLNDAADQVWKNLGYDVKRIDCTSTYRCYGNLHCLVNVLTRS